MAQVPSEGDSDALSKVVKNLDSDRFTEVGHCHLVKSFLFTNNTLMNQTYSVWQSKIYPQFRLKNHIKAIMSEPNAYHTTKALSSIFKDLSKSFSNK